MKWFEKLCLLFSPRCEEISALSSKRLDTELPFSERLSRRLHFLTCASCRRYDRQLKFIQRALRMQPPLPNEHLSPEAQQRIAARIAEERKNVLAMSKDGLGTP